MTKKTLFSQKSKKLSKKGLTSEGESGIICKHSANAGESQPNREDKTEGFEKKHNFFKKLSKRY